ncbi:hypothetical protein PTSG_05389 [Salpingoeca rosetta]|uniref:Uncharacterized protein n=1 Tax=Salpingoeca rosetta (strain ATCC 50818 / BSB-021) TaxID=946362 RepID=F2UAA1_SALR5|nr:uncharacterized protein PTSG_05389 [Salpingoeca rosetta]EGD73676.1 hypothetical protein PTSG_05389 [Salpingoeca rosetta]|eukprot:XP_004993957.1 hypothetical protein PTSG_05389 [Salpingoeca rosetta]
MAGRRTATWRRVGSGDSGVDRVLGSRAVGEGPREGEERVEGEEEEEHEPWPAWSAPVAIVVLSLSLTLFGISLWDVLSTLVIILTAILSLYLPRSLLVAASVRGREFADAEPRSIKGKLRWKRGVATALLMVAPVLQYLAITYINTLSDGEKAAVSSWRVLNPGFVAICSALYTLTILTQDHIEECHQLQARWEKSERLGRRIAAIDARVLELQRRLDGYKHVLQTSVHTVSRLQTGEDDTEIRLEDLAAHMARLDERLQQCERDRRRFDLVRTDHLLRSWAPPSAASSAPPASSHQRMTTTALAKAFARSLMVVEWPWSKAARLMRFAATAVSGGAGAHTSTSPLTPAPSSSPTVRSPNDGRSRHEESMIPPPLGDPLLPGTSTPARASPGGGVRRQSSGSSVGSAAHVSSAGVGSSRQSSVRARLNSTDV